MRNLKKVLALVLTLAMMLSVMVMNTGAVFTDQKDIDSVHTDAVDMCVALKIINGYTDGSYRPDGTITRAEMCKMICVAMNGGKEPVVSASATPVFSDVPSTHWAVGYVESCAAQGIVAGIGGGKFNPDGKVTGTEAAKMMLIALGYDAAQEGFVGSSWDVNTNVKATQKGLYENLEDIDVTAPLTREHAAEMLWNALQADEVEYTYTLVTGSDGALTSKVTVKDKTGDKAEAMSDWYGTIDTDSTCGLMTAFSYSTNKEEWTYTVQEIGANNVLGAAKTYVSDQDFTDLIGHNVTFVVKAGKDADVYGAFADDSFVLASGVLGDIDYADYVKDATVEIDDADIDVDSLATAVVLTTDNNKSSWDKQTVAEFETAIDDTPWMEYAAIDWDDDDDIDLFLVYAATVAEVNYVGSDYVKLVGVTDKYDVGEEDWAVSGDIEKEDLVLVEPDFSAVTAGTITLIEKQTGELASMTGDDVNIDGSTYDASASKTQVQKADLDSDIDFWVVNGYIYDFDKTSSVNLEDYVLVTGVAVVPSTNGYYEANLLFADGTEVTGYIKEVDGVKKAAPVADAGDNLYTYEMSSGKYELTKVTGLSEDDFDEVDLKSPKWQGAESASDADAKVIFADGAAKFADDAVIFVYDNDDEEFFVATGADLAKVTGSAAVYLAGAEKNDKNALTVTFGYIDTEGVSASDELYGFLTSKITYTKDSDGSYETATLWTEDGEQTLTTADTEKFNAAKGDVISYKLDADGAVTDAVKVGAVGALTVIDGDDVTINGTVYEIDKDDTLVLYVDKSENEGVASGALDVATETETEGVYFENVWFLDDDNDGTLELLVVDIDNDWNGDM